MKKPSDNASWIARSPGDPSEQREQREREAASVFKERIVSGIKVQFNGLGTRVFYPASFRDICSEEQALAVLMQLHREGELEARAQIYCPEGELCWEGTPEQVAALKPFRCSECDQEIEDPKEVSALYFAIPKKVEPFDPHRMLREEIERLRAALEQIALPPSPSRVRKIARAALEGK